MIEIHRGTTDKNGMVRVTFSMPAMDDCERLYLVGWFSEWDESVFPMERTSRGDWSLTLELEVGCTYEYRFRTLDGRWLNDPAKPSTPAPSGLNTTFIISQNSLAGSPPPSQ